VGQPRHEQEFADLWARHHQRVHAYALRRTDAAAAQDVVSETFLVAWRRREELSGDVLPWLLGVARNVLANHARSARRSEALTQVLVDQALRRHDSPGDVDFALLRALATLSPPDRELLLLVGWDGLSPAQCAASLGCSAATLRVRLLRARRRLRTQLDQPQGVTEAAVPDQVRSPA
jgi:RNA polymerase sigma factor (sigma-70 family)